MRIKATPEILRSPASSLRARPRAGIAALALALALACGGPTALDLPSQVDRKIADGDIPGACGGLFPEAPDDTREHAANKLSAIPEGVTCVCERVYDPVKHEVDASIVLGLADTKADEPAVCLSKAQMEGRDIFSFDPEGRGAQQYRELAAHVVGVQRQRLL